MTTKTHRLVGLISSFVDGASPLSAEAIRAKVPGYGGGRQAAERRLARDIQELSAIGLPIERHGFDNYYLGEGYSIAAKDYYLPPPEFGAEEKLAVLFLRQMVTSRGEFPFSQELDDLSRRLMYFAGPGELDPVSLPEVGLSPSGGRGGFWEMLWQAVCTRRRLQLKYYRRRESRERERLFDPYGMGMFEARWYLVGYCHTRKQVITMRLTEIRSLSFLLDGNGPDYEIPQDFTLRKYVGGQYWHQPGACSAELEFSPEIAPSVKANYSHLGRFRTTRQGGTLLRTEVGDQKGFINWLLPFQDKVVIRSPDKLRQAMLSQLKKMRRAV
jgi:proteasome accessory factor B